MRGHPWEPEAERRSWGGGNAAAGVSGGAVLGVSVYSIVPASRSGCCMILRYIAGVLSLACLALLVAAIVHTRGFPLLLGSLFLGPDHWWFLGVYGLLGGLVMAGGGVALGHGRAVTPEVRRLLDAGSDRVWVLCAAGAALLVALSLRLFVLHDLPISDDEDTYRFAAQLLAEGRLWAPSPPERLFFDRQFMINDGRWYTQYFLGWPALLAPWVWTGLTGYLNSVLWALTLPALFRVAARQLGRAAGRITLILAVLAPAPSMLAATELSHTACTLALCWAAAWVLDDTTGSRRLTADFGVAAALGVAFWVRPASGIGAGVGIGLIWLWRWWKHDRALARALVFAAVGLFFAATFLGTLRLLNGSVTRTSYQAMLDYVASNHGRFSTFGDHPGFSLFVIDPVRMFVVNVTALARINASFLGWPVSLAFALMARRSTLAWLWLVGLVGVHLAVADVGIETVGPTHFMEAFPAVLWLVVDGLGVLQGRLPPRWRAVPVMAALVAVALSVGVYWPVRISNLARAAEAGAALHRSVDGLPPAIVFVPYPWSCIPEHEVTRSWVLVRPGNRPDLSGPVVWANHLSIDADRALWREHFPDRLPFVAQRDKDCSVHIVPLDAPDRPLPDGSVGGDGYLEPRYRTGSPSGTGRPDPS